MLFRKSRRSASVTPSSPVPGGRQDPTLAASRSPCARACPPAWWPRRCVACVP
ncbi:MAG: hypothetical protein M0C28_31860 [Candidatus Moduliflexus flocculans]|nr:hypothetical protein [Candidatus Moduliflexus flocculans]